MKTLVFADVEDETTAREVARSLRNGGFDGDACVAGPDLRELCAGYGLRLTSPHAIGVTTSRPAMAGRLLREAGAERVRNLPIGTERRDDPAAVDQAGRESFPASDPPSWTP